MAYKSDNFFLSIFFQGGLHLGKDLVVRVVHDADALLGAIGRTQAAAFAEGLDDFGILFFIHDDGTVRTALGAQTALIAIRQIDVGHNAFGLNISILHGYGDPHGCSDTFFTAFLKGHGGFGTAGQRHAVGGKFQRTQLDMGFLEKSVRVGGYFQMPFCLLNGVTAFKGCG